MTCTFSFYLYGKYPVPCGRLATSKVKGSYLCPSHLYTHLGWFTWK
jgi:hypothetical protein